MVRPTRDETFMTVADVVSRRSTCRRRKVGCVLVDEDDQIVSTGYNGVARDHIHCTEQACPGYSSPPGKDLDLCEAVHAEQNAVVQARRSFTMVYCTTMPCPSCVKLFVNTKCKVIYYAEDYPLHRDSLRIARTGGILMNRLQLPGER